MKYAVGSSLVLAACLVAVSNAIAATDPITKTDGTATPLTICGTACTPPPHGGGGGGTTPDYNLTWTDEGSNTVTQQLGGASGSPTPAAAGYNGNIWLAYTSQQSAGTAHGDSYIYLNTYNSALGGGSSLQPTSAPYATSNPATAVAFPATANNSVGLLYLAFNSSQDSNGIDGNGGGFADYMTYNAATASWSAPTGFDAGSGYGGSGNFPYVSWSPALAYDSVNNLLYFAYHNDADQTLTLCKMTAQNVTTCNNFPGTQQMNFNPSMAVFGGTLYIAFEDYANDHNVYLFESTNQGQTITLNTALAGDQSSRSPSLAVHTFSSGTTALYAGYRTNDSNQYFIYRYTTNGTTWASDGTISSPWSMAGSPALLDARQPLSGFTNYALYNFSASDGTSYPNLVSYIGQ